MNKYICGILCVVFLTTCQNNTECNPLNKLIHINMNQNGVIKFSKTEYRFNDGIIFRIRLPIPNTYTAMTDSYFLLLDEDRNVYSIGINDACEQE